MLAVTFDFYNTLVYHRAGIGRGRRYREYLVEAGLSADPWDHQVLYDLFEFYGASYSPALPESAKQRFWAEFTRRLFLRTGVRGPGAAEHTGHASAIREIMGPGCFALFGDAVPALRDSRRAGLRLGVVSDWQQGIAHFCEELGIAGYLDVVVASAEVGHQKPDPRLFDAARERLGIAAGEILHVGDRIEDVEGAEAAGFAAALLVRDGTAPAVDVPVIASLREVRSLF